MNASIKKHLVDLLKTEVVPALGCTEPIAVSLATAKAREALGCTPDKIDIFVSPNILKNGMGVGIPGTGMVGLFIAAALGALYGNSSKQLQLLDGLNPDIVEQAKAMVNNKMVSIGVRSNIDKLYIEAICRKGSSSARACIKGSHSNIVFVEKDGETIEGSAEAINPANGCDDGKKHEKPAINFKMIYEYATTEPFENIRFILEGGYMNKRISEEGLRGDYGLKIGKSIINKIDRHLLKDDLLTYAMAVTTAASDARMAGNLLPAMSNSGSGNQGISVMLPVVATAEKMNSTQEELARALIISNLLAIHIKSQMGRLSALCGISAASAASACGIVYLLGGTYEQMTFAIKNMIGNITGMVCDGAKAGCALKVSSGVSASINAALLAIDNICIQDTDGIINQDVEETISNLALIGSDGMEETDKMILDMMLKKK